mmetsp:Transcript_119600/g.168226  ORF Transcript_119600/g.168226 Transcript_119600/m.168226 type:complete len:247 (-) Transcript_119600:24-764(-)
MCGQGGDAALTFLAILHTATVRGLPELGLRVAALKLDAVGHPHRRAVTNPVPAQLQGFHGHVADIALGCNLFDFRIVVFATQLEVGSVSVLAHGPGTPLLMCDDHAPLIYFAGTAVQVAIHDRWDGALPIVAGHLDEIALLGHARSVPIDINEVHGGSAAGRGEGVGVPHLPRSSIALLLSTPHRYQASSLVALGAEPAPSQGLAGFKALQSSCLPHGRRSQGPVLTGRCQAPWKQGKQCEHHCSR